jgi:hypothetical protein
LLNLTEWWNKVFKDEGNQFSLYRKSILFKVILKLFDTIKSDFVHFMQLCMILLLINWAITTNNYQLWSGTSSKSKRKHQELELKQYLDERLY